MATPTGIILNLTDPNKAFDVISSNYYFSQGVGPDGRPNGSVVGGQINLSIVSTEDTFLAEWMCDASKFYDGNVTFYQPDDLSKTMKTLTFKKAFCISFSESISTGGNGSQTIALTVNEISIGNADINNNWPA